MGKYQKKLLFKSFEKAREFARTLGLISGKEWEEYAKSGKRPEDIPKTPQGVYKDKGWNGFGDWLGTGKICTRSKRFGQPFRAFEKAREFARTLGLTSGKEWKEYCKSGKKPEDIPNTPNNVYKDKGWKGFGDWLGTGKTARYLLMNQKQLREFEKAREFARTLGLGSRKEWEEYAKSGKKPNDIPFSVHTFYKGKGWNGWKDFLGTKPVKWRPFEKAREFARSLGLKNGKEWYEYSKSGKRPKDIPSAPRDSYKGKGWKGLGDWLGSGSTRRSTREYRPFEEAREFVRALGLKNDREWKEYSKSEKIPEDIPSTPNYVYKDKGWKGLGDFLGTGTTALQNMEYRSFEEAREFVRTLGLKNGKEWYEYSKSGKRPEGIHSSPYQIYKGKGWNGWRDFLGIRKREYRPFEEAREFARSLGLKSSTKWKELHRSGKIQEDIPSRPNYVYKGKGWNGWRDFLGIRKREYRPFEEAREFVRTLGLKNGKEWYEYSKSGKKPEDIPGTPHRVYKGKGWKGFGDWLGNGPNWRPFEEAREFVRALGLTSITAWSEYCKSGKKPEDIPSTPNRIYKGKGWKSISDWLGTEHRGFTKGREFVRTLGLKNQIEWREYCKSGKKPAIIPSRPENAYKKQWKGMPDWLGVRYYSKKHSKSFSAARRFARSLGLKSGREWRELHKSGKIPVSIPLSPDDVYKKEWKNWGDFLGTGTVANQYRNILSYNEAEKLAKEICKELKIDTPTKWKNAARAGKIPKNLPTYPPTYYQRKRGIAKNVENEFYTTWFKFSGMSSEWTEEMSDLVMKDLTREINDPNLLLDTFMLLYTNCVLTSGKHKAEFADMITRITKGELELDQIDFKGKVNITIILFYIVNYIDSDSEAYLDL